MKKIEVLIILLGILFLLIPLIFAKVYINEVELNPESNDLGKEWIELYNNGTAVNLSGWYIIRNDGNNYSLPAITINDFYVFDNLNWLTNNNQNLSLFNSSNDIQDNTGVFSDTNNDNRTWQRVPDGTGSFIFKNNSKNFSNYNGIINVPGDYANIQTAINNANEGDIVNVFSGIYNEQLIINKQITLKSSNGASLTKLNCQEQSFCLIINANSAVVDGFMIYNDSKRIDATSKGIDVRGNNTLIKNNIIEGERVDADEEKVGIYIRETFNNTLVNNEIYNWGWYGINNYFGKNTKIIDNYIHNNLYYGISSDRSNNTLIKNNTIQYEHNYSGIVLFDKNTEESVSSEILENTIENNGVGIVISGADFVNISDNLIKDNTKYGIRMVYSSWLSSNAENNKIYNNKLVNNENGSIVNGSGNIFRFNDFTNFQYGIINQGAWTVDAKFNWWGHCTGPGGVGNGSGDNVSQNVLYSPWLGICIENKTNMSCAFETDDVKLEADLIGLDVSSVWFSYIINGTNYNKTASISGTKYFIYINSSQLIGGKNISWNVYANDSSGNVFNNSWKSFYVNKRTVLEVNKSNTDGLNGWYVTEPLFSLIKDSSLGNVYYKWDSSGSILYTGVFGLEDIPNPPKESAGILELNWWTDFVICGNEKEQNKTFKIDLTSPLIKNLIPANNSIVYNNAKPTIEAYLDEVYQSNSGINKNTVLMKLDEQNVSANVFNADTLDAIVRHNPVSNLAEGWHKISVYVEDNAGRKTNLNWSFYVNLSIPLFNLSVYSPLDKIYGDKKIIFNITTSDIVSKIEFINWNDKNQEWNILCRNCDEYGNSRKKSKTFNENWNNITIRAVDFFGNYKELNISFFADSKEPVISNIFPSKNKITNGSDFYIKYSENNLKEILLNWNPSENLTHCNESGKNKECYAELNLSSYDGEYINFWFNVSDVFRTIQSKVTIVKVDTTSPILIINLPENKTGNESYGFRVPFNLSVSEKVLLEYYDKLDSNPKWKRLCVNCDNYGLIKTKNKFFKKGTHNIFIRAIDKASNSDIKEVKFEVV